MNFDTFSENSDMMNETTLMISDILSTVMLELEEPEDREKEDREKEDREKEDREKEDQKEEEEKENEFIQKSQQRHETEDNDVYDFVKETI